jgi:preprotein translocase subunit SecA
MDEALAHFERREAELTPDVMRQVERQVMLRVIDQRWRAHLHEMDYLREGINLRAMGQKDPLVEWQRDGFDMFGQMMHGIWQDFIRYVMHVQVQVNRQPAEAPAAADAPTEPATVGAGNGDAEDGVRGLQYSSPADPSSTGGAASIAAAARAQPVAAAEAAEPAPSGDVDHGRRSGAQPAAVAANTPMVKSEWEKTPRNARCPCGSGKKYKQCHGR